MNGLSFSRWRSSAARTGMILPFLLAALTAARLDAEPLRPGETRTNVVYGSYSGLDLLMDVKSPLRPNGFALLHIPGSGFQAPLALAPYDIKDPARQADAERPFLDAGFTIFTINYRVAPRFKYPAAVEDAQRAARFIWASAPSLGLRSGWLGIMGESSGGTLALTLATRGEGSDDSLDGPPGGERAQCVIAGMPGTDLLALGQDGWAVALVTNYLDVTAPFPEEAGLPGYADRLKRFIDASPIDHVDRRPLPRMLLIHGDKDKLVPISQSESFLARAHEAGATADFIRMPGVGHAYPAPYPERAAQWMSECLKATRG